MTAATTMRMGGAGVTARDHCPTCGHRHQRGPTGRLVCGGDDGTCKCDPADPCRCGVCEMARASRAERKPSAGWVELYGNHYLAAGDVSARANPSGWWCVYRGRWTPAEWQRTSHRVIREGKTAPGIGAAMSGAEDALLAIAAEIVGAVGR